MRQAPLERASFVRGRPVVETFATEGSIPQGGLQPQVAIRPKPLATVGGVKAADYWKSVGAPKIRARKEALGRSVSNTAIAAKVEEASGKSTSRQLVEEFMKGEREPYISQLVALCAFLELEIEEVLTPAVERTPALRTGNLRFSKAKVRTAR